MKVEKVQYESRMMQVFLKHGEVCLWLLKVAWISLKTSTLG
jgi:hypothetical protein